MNCEMCGQRKATHTRTVFGQKLRVCLQCLLANTGD